MGFKKHSSNKQHFDTLPYYIDDECKRLEGIIRTRSEYSRWNVKKLSIGDTFAGDPPQLKDPFAILSGEGEHMAWLYTWEIETLSNHDNLLAYLTVEVRRSKIADTYDFGMLMVAISNVIMWIFLGAMLISSSMIPQTPSQSGLFIATIPIIFSGLLIWYLVIRRKRNLLLELDTEFARENDEFREALRLLASLSDYPALRNMTEYVRRHKITENALLSGK